MEPVKALVRPPVYLASSLTQLFRPESLQGPPLLVQQLVCFRAPATPLAVGPLARSLGAWKTSASAKVRWEAVASDLGAQLTRTREPISLTPMRIVQDLSEDDAKIVFPMPSKVTVNFTPAARIFA